MKTSARRGRPPLGTNEFTGKKAIKIEIARRIAAHLRDLDLTQAEASSKYKIDQGVMSRICNANLEIFSVDRLIGLAESMGIVANINFED
jgi:predicted XRE-type DNA-binding protein